MLPQYLRAEPRHFRELVQIRYCEPRFTPEGIQTHARLTDSDLDRVMRLADGLYKIANRSDSFPRKHNNRSLQALQRALAKVGIRHQLVAVREQSLREFDSADFDTYVLDQMYTTDLQTDEYMVMPTDLITALECINHRYGEWSQPWRRAIGLIWRYADLLAWHDPSDTTAAARHQVWRVVPHLAGNLFLGVSRRNEHLYVVTR